MFADLLCRGFGYLHPLFICHNGYFFQYFTNERMQYAASYGYDWLSDAGGFDEYQKNFTAFHQKSFSALKNILQANLSPSKIKQFFDIIYQYFIFYSKMDFQFTNTTYLRAGQDPILAKNLAKLSAFKDVARVWINDVATDEHCFLNALLQKLSDKYDIDTETLNYYKIDEIMQLSKHKVPEDEINTRKPTSVVWYDGYRIRYAMGQEAINYIKKVKKAEQAEAKKDIVGQVAHRGENRYVTGRVRIINVDYSNPAQMNAEIQKMQQGEILVSESTAPELMSACSKAKAIVTDMGGQLSHAAIVSRELNIPCVVGTSHATRSLKNNNKIKIDLDTGNIKII